MTNREFFVAVANGEVNEDVMAHAAEAIVKMDKTLAKRREAAANGTAPRKVSEETVAKRSAIWQALVNGGEPMNAPRLAEITGYSTNTVSGVMRYFVTNGNVTKSSQSYVGEDGKKKTAVFYTIVNVESAEDEG